MDVHHPHHLNHKKNWKEYITEFLMLFFAVTLGFFAENLREHQVEKSREIQFLQNIHFDLEQDIKEIDKTIAFNTEKQLMNDSLILLYDGDGYKRNLPRFYYFLKNTTIRKYFDHSSTGFAQLKNAGGLRLIEDKSIISKIISIENSISNVEKLQESMEQNLLLLREDLGSVLNPITNNQMNRNQNMNAPDEPAKILRRYNYPENPRPFITDNPKDLHKLVNFCVATVNTTFHINRGLANLKKQEEELNKEILEKFGSHFKNE